MEAFLGPIAGALIIVSGLALVIERGFKSLNKTLRKIHNIPDEEEQ